MGVDYGEYLAKLIKETLAKYPVRVAHRLKDYPLVGPSGVRKVLGGFDLEFFGKAYFPEYHKHSTPWFHKEAYAELDRVINNPPRRARIVRAWPRSNAKSTIYNFFVPTNAALYGKRRMMVQASDSESQAEGFLADIKNALDNKEYILEDFGDTRGAVWRSDMISVKSASGDTSWIVAVGAGSSVRGLRKAENRPSLITIDDLENDDSVLTPDRIDKMWLWFQRALMNLGDEYTDVIAVGTVLAENCVLDRLLRSPTWDTKKLSAVIKWSASPLWEDWKKIYTDLSLSKEAREATADEFYAAHEAEMLDGTEVLWPEGKPYVELMKINVDIGETAFYSEHQNEPINFAECLFRPEWLYYYDQEELDRVRIVDIIGAIDPSLGKNKMSDYTAFITLGRGDNGFIYVLDAVVERMTPDRIIELVLAKATEYNYTRVGIEVHAFQELLRSQLARESALRRIYLPIVDIRFSKDKVLRVSELIPLVKNHYLRFNREHRLLIEQLLGFPKLSKDDGPDALHQAATLIIKGPVSDPMLTGVVPSRGYHDDDDDDDDAPKFNARHFYS